MEVDSTGLIFLYLFPLKVFLQIPNLEKVILTFYRKYVILIKNGESSEQKGLISVLEECSILQAKFYLRTLF